MNPSRPSLFSVLTAVGWVLSSFGVFAALSAARCGGVLPSPANQVEPLLGSRAADVAPLTTAPEVVGVAAGVAGATGSAATLTLRCDAPTHPISPLIYGIGVLPMHDAPESHEWLLSATARRWGGNHTSRYNWELGNAWNAGKDWFFQNVDYDRSPQPAHERFIDANLVHGLSTALTVPIIGWGAKDTSSYGFPVSIHGAQQTVAPGNGDMGNGLTERGRPIAPGGPERTSVPLSPASIGRWVQSIRARDASRPRRGVQMYILDNEPTLWSETHRDVHPQPVSYDELLSRTIAYATAIRAADQSALIAGPALWGWPAYFHSGVDQAAHPAHPDQDSHGAMPLLPWWLREVAAHERREGVRLLDVVDVHFYPQGRGMGVGLAGDTDPDTAARRLRATRSLWDPAYTDESWIGERMRVIPRLRAWIADHHPGLGISIGEWNFGAERHMSGGLAVAEALGRFGEQGILSAFYWDYPEQNSPAFWAFRAFRNYDGRGGRFLDDSVATSSDEARVSVFASREAATGRLVLVLLNLDPTRRIQARLDASSCGRIVGEQRFAYEGGAAGLTAAAGRLGGAPQASLALPPYSMTILDLRVAQD